MLITKSELARLRFKPKMLEAKDAKSPTGTLLRMRATLVCMGVAPKAKARRSPAAGPITNLVTETERFSFLNSRTAPSWSVTPMVKVDAAVPM